MLPTPTHHHSGQPTTTRALPTPTDRHRRVCAGCLSTAGVLCVGFGAFINGNKALAQNMMRARVMFQGLTVLGMGIATSWAATSSQPTPEA